MDPIEALRSCISNNTLIEWNREKKIVILGDHTFPENSPTKLKSSKFESSYLLKSIILFYQTRASLGSYLNLLFKYNIPNDQKLASEQDRRPLLAYLESKTDTLISSNNSTIYIESSSDILDSAHKDSSTALKTEFFDNKDKILTKEQADIIDINLFNNVFSYYELLHPTKNFSNIDATKNIKISIPEIDQVMLSLSKKTTSHSKKIKNKSTTKIIIVPATMTSLINLSNATEFLQNYIFIPPTVPESSIHQVTIFHNKKKYHILDSGARLSKEEFKQKVVAIFVQTPTYNAVTNNTTFWQFRNWPYDQPATLFSMAKGFHLCYDDDTFHLNNDANLANAWAVNNLTIGKRSEKRYLDSAVVNQFWNIIEKEVEDRDKLETL